MKRGLGVALRAWLFGPESNKGQQSLDVDPTFFLPSFLLLVYPSYTTYAHRHTQRLFLDAKKDVWRDEINGT